MALTDNELGMIEQLCYLNGDVAGAAGISDKFKGIDFKEEGKTIEEMLSCFDEAALKELEKKGKEEIDGSCASAKEWASIIRYLQQTEGISDLVLSDTMSGADGVTLALCFTEGEGSSEAVVAFKGTSGGQEWADNVEGLNSADTGCQLDALDYIESLNYDDITVTGHSKGGNKAMYVSITSGKVKRCVSFDGQGFSQEFIDKYWAEIERRGGNIKNYSLSTDYVHALMFPVPNSKQIYCQGFNVDNVKQHHSPNSFFMSDNGENLILDSDGNPIIVVIDEDNSIGMLHDFTVFVMNQASSEDKKVIISYVSGLLSMVFGEGGASAEELIDFALADPDALALIIAYLAIFMDEYGLEADDIDKLLETIGLNKLNMMVDIADFEVLGVPIDVNLNLANIINFVRIQLNDEDGDIILQTVLLPLMKSLFFNDVDIDISAFWSKIDSRVRAYKVQGFVQDCLAKTGQIHDFSMNVYDTLMGVVDKISASGFGNLSGWNQYAQYDWFSKLFISSVIRGINAYADNVITMNRENKRRIEKLFADIAKIDSTYALKIRKENDRIRNIAANISASARK